MYIFNIVFQSIESNVKSGIVDFFFIKMSHS